MAVPTVIHVPHLGDFPPGSDLIPLETRGNGFHRVGKDGGNIVESGTRTLYHHYEHDFQQILARLGLSQ